MVLSTSRRSSCTRASVYEDFTYSSSNSSYYAAYVRVGCQKKIYFEEVRTCQKQYSQFKDRMKHYSWKPKVSTTSPHHDPLEGHKPLRKDCHVTTQIQVCCFNITVSVLIRHAGIYMQQLCFLQTRRVNLHNTARDQKHVKGRLANGDTC